jgi:hypothetical protein
VAECRSWLVLLCDAIIYDKILTAAVANFFGSVLDCFGSKNDCGYAVSFAVQVRPKLELQDGYRI